MEQKRAVLYLRSSKDRSDVSIAAQRRELQALAAERGYTVIKAFSDVVESGKSEFRPGFQALIQELKSPARQWSTLLLLDTARLARRTYIAHAFKHECEKRGVSVVYAKLPETDPITRVVLENVFQAMDEVHSLMSKEKGIAGMTENVKKGFRAGGRAPKGYRLRHIETGAVREGRQVTKSVLEPNEEAPLIQRYLEQRAAGVPRTKAARLVGLDAPGTTLMSLDWNALTYAGHTVWNVMNERNPGGGYKGGTKRRPREEWIIKHDTHPALITTAQAEAILKSIETSTRAEAARRARSAGSEYLLSGLLETPEGDPWYGDSGKHYRTKRQKGQKNRWVSRAELEGAVTAQIMQDMQSARFAKALAHEARLAAETPIEDSARELRKQVKALNGQIDKATDLCLKLDDPAPLLRKIDQLEEQRKALVSEIERIDHEQAARSAVAAVTPDQVRDVLRLIASEMGGREQLKELIRSFVDRVVLDPSSLECTVHYRFEVQKQDRSGLPLGTPT